MSKYEKAFKELSIVKIYGRTYPMHQLGWALMKLDKLCIHQPKKKDLRKMLDMFEGGEYWFGAPEISLEESIRYLWSRDFVPLYKLSLLERLLNDDL